MPVKRITPQDWECIQEMRESGMSITDISQSTGFSRKAVWTRLKKENQTNLEDYQRYTNVFGNIWVGTGGTVKRCEPTDWNNPTKQVMEVIPSYNGRVHVDGKDFTIEKLMTMV